MPQLIEQARKENLTEITGIKKQDLIFKILKERVKLNGLMFGEGTLEILPDGFGFLRSPDYHYLSCPDDIYVSPSQIRRFGLRTGATVSGQIRPPKENERYFALLRVEAINYQDPNQLSEKVFFDDLTPLHPDKRVVLEADGRRDQHAGGRPDRADRLRPARLDRQPAAGRQDDPAAKNGQEPCSPTIRKCYVIMLLIDERPEEVTDMERQVKGPNCEVISSTFDEPSARPHPGVGNGHRKGQADGRIRPRRGDFPGFDHAAGAGLELRSARTRARFFPAASMPTRCSGPSGSSARPARSRKAAR